MYIHFLRFVPDEFGRAHQQSERFDLPRGRCWLQCAVPSVLDMFSVARNDHAGRVVRRRKGLPLDVLCSSNDDTNH